MSKQEYLSVCLAEDYAEVQHAVAKAHDKFTSGHVCCGAGGDIVGVKATGRVMPVWAFDYSYSAVATVLSNHPDVMAFYGDVRHVKGLKPVDMLFCGIPCQPYTRIGARRGEGDERAISLDLVRIIRQVSPRFLLFENVREYKSSSGFEALNNSLKPEYSLLWSTLNMADYGVPQRRVRLFGVGVRGDGIALEFPAPTHTKEKNLLDDRTEWVRFGNIRDGKGMKPLSAKELKGVFRRLRRHSMRGNGFSVQIIDDQDMMMTVLGVMYRGSGTGSNSTLVWDGGRVRSVSLLEARRAQGFDDAYQFCGTIKEIWQQVANAWPPLMVKKLVETLLHSG